MQSVWFDISEGPLLEAAERVLGGMRRYRAAGGERYRIGAQRRQAGKRQIEILFEGEGDVKAEVLSRLYLNL